jgi:hypothetical protein
MELTLAVVTTLAALGLLAAVTVGDSRRLAKEWQRHRLDFGRDVTAATVTAVLDHLSGLQGGRRVVLEVDCEAGRISHYLETDRATMEAMEGGLTALMPGLRLRAVDAANRPTTRLLAIRLGGRSGNLRTDGAEASSLALLGALAPLAEGEGIRLRWQVTGGRAQLNRSRRSRAAFDFESYRNHRTKNASRILLTGGTLETRAASMRRATELSSRVGAVLKSRSTAGGELRLFAAPTSLTGLFRRWLPLSSRLNSAELSGVIGWPIGGPTLPGLRIGTSPVLMASERLPQGDRVIGDTTWPGQKQAVAQPVLGALSHTLVAGPTGVGKSTLLTNLITADMNAGRAVLLIDGKGDTAAQVLARVPKGREEDLVLLDCGCGDAQPGLRLFQGTDSELAADVVLGVLADLFKDNWGPLSERYLRAGLIAVANDPEGSLADLPFVFSDAGYRRRLVGRVGDPLTKATFASLESMSPAGRLQQLAAPLNRLGALLGRPIVRTVLGQADPSLDFSRALREGQIVVISLAPARVGGPASRLIGALSLFAFFQAVQARSGTPERAREAAFAYVDEPRALGDMPMPLDSLLEQSRGLGVGICIAPQSVGRLSGDVRSTVLTNVATRIVFRQNAEDAKVLARDFREVSADDLSDLSAWETVARIGLGPGDIAPAVTIRTRPPVPPLRDGRELAARARSRWGRTIEEVDASLRARHGQQKGDRGPVGRRARRQP